MPKDNIERAIARGSGADADADAYETVVYEGYGAGGVAVLVEALTDNRNRTAADVRHVVREARRQPRRDRAPSRGCSSAAASCSWTPDGVDEDELMLAAAEGGRGRRRARRLELPGHGAPETLDGGARGARGGGLRASSRPS